MFWFLRDLHLKVPLSPSAPPIPFVSVSWNFCFVAWRSLLQQPFWSPDLHFGVVMTRTAGDLPWCSWHMVCVPSVDREDSSNFPSDSRRGEIPVVSLSFSQPSVLQQHLGNEYDSNNALWCHQLTRGDTKSSKDNEINRKQTAMVSIDFKTLAMLEE